MCRRSFRPRAPAAARKTPSSESPTRAQESGFGRRAAARPWIPSARSLYRQSGRTATENQGDGCNFATGSTARDGALDADFIGAYIEDEYPEEGRMKRIGVIPSVFALALALLAPAWADDTPSSGGQGTSRPAAQNHKQKKTEVHTTVTGPNGRTTTRSATTTRQGNTVTRNGTVTGPRGRTATRHDTWINDGGTIVREDTVTGPRGKTTNRTATLTKDGNTVTRQGTTTGPNGQTITTSTTATGPDAERAIRRKPRPRHRPPAH